MKKNYFILLILSLCVSATIHSQQVLFEEDFETNFAANASALEGALDGWGEGFTFPVINANAEGDAGSSWYGRMERESTLNHAALNLAWGLTQGNEYSYSIAIKPDALGQKAAYKLEVIDAANGNAVVAGEVKLSGTGADWETLTVTYTAAATQPYSFRLTKIWGDQGASYDSISLTCTSCTTASVKDNNAFGFTLFPNPIKHVFYYDSEEKLSAINIYNLLGKEVLKVSEPSQNSVDVSNLNKGIYILKLVAYNGGTVVRKIMKQ